MTLAYQYAKAIHELLKAEPTRSGEFVAGLRKTLAARGHERVLPRIRTELEKIQYAESRAAAARATTPERERTRVLFELYKKLTASR